MAFAPALLLLIVIGGFCGWVYYRREFAVRGRPLLLTARLVAVAGLLIVLWNPSVATGARGGQPTHFVVLDASRSMAAVSSGGESVWDDAKERARVLEGEGARILVAGAAVRATDGTALDSLSPMGSESVLARAIGVAAEAGARRVTVVTDRRVEDPLAATALAERLGVTLAVDSLREAGPNVGLARLIVPRSVEGGTAVTGRVELEGSSPADSVSVQIDVDGQPYLTLRVAAPGEGGVSAASFTLEPSLATGPHRIVARLGEGDAFSQDDQRTRIVEVDPEESGALLVSFLPDWEPRFLYPVLEQVTGLPTRGFVRTGPDRFHPMGGGASIDQATLGRLVTRAELVVAMGVDGSVQGFLEPLTARTRRLVVFARDAAGASLGGVGVGGALQGEWYVDAAPPSPIAGDVGDFVTGELPPLSRILPVVDEGGGQALDVRLGGAGQPEAALVLRATGGRRIATVLGRGFWRWAFRDGSPRNDYRRLWAAVGGWMMADEPLAAGPGIRPALAVSIDGEPTRWQGFGHEAEDVTLAVTDSTGAVVVDSVMQVPQGGLFTGPILPPGSYAYTASLATDTTRGVFEIERFTDEMLHRPLPASSLTTAAATDAAGFEGSRPLRTWPFPYLLILAALCAEWIGRRRAGLR